MITYFQQNKTKYQTSFCECSKAHATHFSEDDGKKMPLNQLTANHLTTNVPVQDEDETLIMPTINFDGEDDKQVIKKDGDNEMHVMPTLNFDNDEKKKIAEKNSAIGKDKKITENAVYDDTSGVPATPCMF